MGSTFSCPKLKKTIKPKEDAFSKTELAIIQKQWSIVMRNVDGNGHLLFSKLFVHKDVMSKFNFAVANELDYKKTLNDARLLFHIRRVFHTLNSVISCLHDMEQIASQLQHVGAIHVKYGVELSDLKVIISTCNVSHNDGDKKLKNFKAALLETLLCVFKQDFDKQAEMAWTKLADDVILHMMSGINQSQPEEWWNANEAKQ